MGQAYPAAAVSAAGPADLRPSIRFRRPGYPPFCTPPQPASRPRPRDVQTRYEPGDGWAQPQPQQQGQSWPPADTATMVPIAAAAAELRRPATATGRNADGLQPAGRRSLRYCAGRASLGPMLPAELPRGQRRADLRCSRRRRHPAYAYPSVPRGSLPEMLPAGPETVARGPYTPAGSGGRPARGRGRRGRRPVQQSRAHDDSHAHRRSAPRSADADFAGRNANGPADVRRRRELRCRPGGQHHARRTELRLDESAHQLGRHHGRPRLPRRRRAVPLGTGARHPGPALHDQLPGAVPERISR